MVEHKKELPGLMARRDVWIAALIGLLALALYTRTLAP